MHTRLSELHTKHRESAPAVAVTLRTVTLTTGHRLSLRQGDLCAEPVEAIVNAANEGLGHGGGIAGAIVRRGGFIIQQESDRVGRVPTGSAAITGAGTLPAKYVIHAVGPKWHGYTPENADRLLASATTAALEIARERGLSSVAFTAISSGIFGFPKDRCAAVMLRAVRSWADIHANDVPSDIRFTIIDDETVSVFAAAFDANFPSAVD